MKQLPQPEWGPSGTCDWGGCDLVSRYWRWSAARGWLSVCERHRMPSRLSKTKRREVSAKVQKRSTRSDEIPVLVHYFNFASFEDFVRAESVRVGPLRLGNRLVWTGTGWEDDDRDE